MADGDVVQYKACEAHLGSIKESYFSLSHQNPDPPAFASSQKHLFRTSIHLTRYEQLEEQNERGDHSILSPIGRLLYFGYPG
ncbi:hypothetical protein PoB_004095800 [Plakobranchus ocellatus]|uniref:Uncharacterized protein n=1 Tax=Plakobranchus ocellatus TaxID=259542 RepID=A0AAV4B4F5_9GAST|nr:hypothetical protein PoB_004095800 [Plakobranchus ocellatus]